MDSLLTTLWQTSLALESLSGSNSRPFSVLAPEIVLFTVLLWCGLAAAVFFSRATPRRTFGALAAGFAFMLLFVVEEILPASLGLRHFTWTIAPPPTGLIYTGIIPYGAMIALLGWRITRKFGWRGQVALLFAATFGGPLRDYITTLYVPGVAAVPGGLPWISDGILWLGGVGSGQAILRLIAGRAGGDTYTPLSWKP